MTCPSHIYSKICEGETNGLGSIKIVRKRIKHERLGDKVQEGKPYFEERINMGTCIGSVRVMTLVVQSERNAGHFASNLAYFNSFIRSLRKICMLSKLCLFRGMHFIISLSDYKNLNGVSLCIGFPCGGI